MAEARMFYEKDCNLSLLDGKTIAVIGYGSQGHAHALNAKESGCNVIIGLYEGSKSWAKAEPDAKKGYVITHRCVKCGAVRRNRAALSGEQSDDIRKIIRLTAQGKQ